MHILMTLAAVALGIVVLVVAALLLFTYTQARRLLRPDRKPLAIHPPDLGLPFQEIHFPGRQGTIAGWYLPARNGCTLICCHGINDNAAQWAEQVARLHARGGYGALMFDFAGHGRSDGALVTFGIHEQDDIAAAMDYLRSRGDADMQRLGLLGYSLGAISAVLYAARHSQTSQQTAPIRALVIESGFADLLRDIGVLFHRYTGLPSFPFAQLVVFWAERISGVRLAQIRPAQVIERVSPGAVLVISDLKDDLADEPYDGERLYSAAGEPKALWQVPEAGHVQAFTARPDEWVERVGSFLDEHLAGATSEATVPPGELHERGEAVG
jgi:pimeloyl-ACP methyl ester carboxylesterase